MNTNQRDSAEKENDKSTRKVQVEKKVLSRNDEVAQSNYEWLSRHGTIALNFISSPGTGKTLLLEKTLSALAGEIECAVLVGDQQSDNDARRLADKGARVQQIETGSSCHLDAERVSKFLHQVVFDTTRLLFIENVGNLICPAAYRLGEKYRVTLLSVPEGEDKPVKYPPVFARADIIILTKVDLVEVLEFDMQACLNNIKSINPTAKVLQLSAKTGVGMDQWLGCLREIAAVNRAAT